MPGRKKPLKITLFLMDFGVFFFIFGRFFLIFDGFFTKTGQNFNEKRVVFLNYNNIGVINE